MSSSPDLPHPSEELASALPDRDSRDTVREGHGAGAVFENVTESTVACLLAMSQGSVLAFGLGHWIVASQTGVAAGIVTAAALWLSGGRGRWVVAGVLGVATAGVDFIVHPSGFGPGLAEPLVTGAIAAALSLVVAHARDRRRRARAASGPGEAAGSEA